MELKMVYDAMEDMANAFTQGAQTLEALTSELNNIAAALEGGALLGRGGDAFVSAIRDRLIGRVNRLRDKFQELNRDVIVAMGEMRREDLGTERTFED